ncbi:MAG: hypothetical protein GY754_21165 [bacterium]|nr:hypothetical protein [bacterium]
MKKIFFLLSILLILSILTSCLTTTSRNHRIMQLSERELYPDSSSVPVYIRYLELSEQDLKELEKKELIPKYIIDRLVKLKNRQYTNEDKFFDALEKAIGDKDALKKALGDKINIDYKAQILENASKGEDIIIKINPRFGSRKSIKDITIHFGDKTSEKLVYDEREEWQPISHRYRASGTYWPYIEYMHDNQFKREYVGKIVILEDKIITDEELKGNIVWIKDIEGRAKDRVIHSLLNNKDDLNQVDKVDKVDKDEDKSKKGLLNILTEPLVEVIKSVKKY